MPVAAPLALALAALPAARAAAVRDGPFVVTDRGGDNELRLGGRVQFRYTHEALEADAATTLNGLELEAGTPETVDTLEARRVRLSVKGRFLDGAASAKLQLAWDRGSPGLKDAWIDGRIGEHAGLRLGRFKMPWTREALTSSGRLALVERSIFDAATGAGRDAGLMLHGAPGRDAAGLEWAAGLFQGASDAAGDWGPSLALRAGWRGAGFDGYDTVDLDGGGPRGGLAVGAVLDGPFGDLPGDPRARGTRLGLDGGLKVAGFAAFAEGFVGLASDGPWTDQEPVHLGARAEANRLVAGAWLPAARVALARDLDADATQTELTAGLGYLLDGHRAKAQADFGRVLADGWDAWLLRAQAQLAW